MSAHSTNNEGGVRLRTRSIKEICVTHFQGIDGPTGDPPEHSSLIAFSFFIEKLAAIVSDLII
ncbi:MAG: hypothetical protein ABIR24_10900 [Verrucomicrobiota bacterium]